MKSQIKSSVAYLVLNVFLLFCAAGTSAETFTMETTYPSPMGAYDKVDSGQIRFNGYTQAEIDAGALQTEAEKTAGTPPAPGRIFYNKDAGYFFYTSPDADPADKSTWYKRFAVELSNMQTLIKGKADSCVVLAGSLATDYATAKKEKKCPGSYYAAFNIPPEIGAKYDVYSIKATSMPKGKSNWVYDASCTLSITGLPAKLYKCIKKVCTATSPLAFRELAPNSTLAFSFGYLLYSYNGGGWIFTQPRKVTDFPNNTYSYTMTATNSFKNTLEFIRTYVYYANVPITHHERDIPAVADSPLPDDAAHNNVYYRNSHGNFYYIPNWYYYTQRLSCDNVSAGILLY